MTNRMVLCGSVAALVLTLTAGMAAQQPAVKRTILQQADISAPGREAITARAEFPAGAETGRHTHPGEEISYVEEGSLVLEVDGQPTRTVKAGEVFLVPAGVIHNAKPVSGTAKVIVNYVVEKGKPVTSPAPAR